MRIRKFSQLNENENQYPFLKDDERRIEEAVKHAEHYFWEGIAEKYPEVSSGDLDPGTVFELNAAMEKAVHTWLYYNDPNANLYDED